MKELKRGNATVRLHGEPDMEALQAATEKFAKKVYQRKRQNEKSKK